MDRFQDRGFLNVILIFCCGVQLKMRLMKARGSARLCGQSLKFRIKRAVIFTISFTGGKPLQGSYSTSA